MGIYYHTLIKTDKPKCGIQTSTLKQMLTANHFVDAEEGVTTGQIPLEHIFYFCKTLNIINGPAFHKTFKIASLQDVIYTT